MAQQVVLAISGSPSSTSRTALVAQHVLGMLRSECLETKFLSIRDLPAEALLRANIADPKIAEALSLVESAAGIVIATPIFKAAYSGLLKCMLDILPQFALAGKALLPIATGGSVAHVLALDWFDADAADGFVVMPAYFPGALDAFVDRVIPILQKRGLFRTEYESTTLRGHLGLSRPIHAAAAPFDARLETARG
jgi:hypothetical protein